MKLVRFSVVVALLYHISTIEVLAAEPSKLPIELWRKAQEVGTVRIIVEFNMPWQVEAHLSSSARLAQRNNIAAN